MSELKVGDRVRYIRTLDWGQNWQDCTITGLPSSGSRYFDVKNHDGRSGMMAADEMELISNVTPHPAPSPSEVGPEVVERMIALVRRVADAAHDGNSLPHPSEYWAIIAEARAIVALLPEPVDAIEAIARRLIDQHDEPWPEGSESDRLHYWRDKAIQAANDLRALEKEAGR